MRYFGKYPNNTSLEEIKELFLPYRYGHATQVQLRGKSKNIDTNMSFMHVCFIARTSAHTCSC